MKKEQVPNIYIGLDVIVKATQKEGKVTSKQDGFWVVTFPNRHTSKYATYQLKAK